MKIGDLISCPIDLKTGEMFKEDMTLAIVITLYKNEPKLGVVYIDCSSYIGTNSVWYTEEVKLLSEG